MVGGAPPDSARFGDSQTDRFFMRVQFDLGETVSVEDVQTVFGPLAHAIKMFSEQRILLNDGKTVVFT